MSLWSRIAERILSHALPIVVVVVGLTAFLGYWATQVKTDHTAGHFLSADARVLQTMARAGQIFGQSQTILYVAFEGANPYDRDFLRQVQKATQEIGGYPGVDHVLSLTNVPYLMREGQTLTSQPLYDASLDADALEARLRAQPFLRGLLLSNDGTTAGMLIKINAVFNDTPERVDLVRRIEADLEQLPGDAAFAGFPYLRTHYAHRISTEAPLFAALALVVSLLFLYLTFQSWRAVILPTVIVMLGIVWTVGLISLFDHRLNIVTAALPALIVIIGMATAIHICTKFFDEYGFLGDRRQALFNTIQSVGLATFLTSLTTAIGFAVLVLSGSHLLAVFGEFAAVGIMLLYGLSITLIPIAFAYLRPPSVKVASLATHDVWSAVFERLAHTVRHRSSVVVAVALAMSAIGVAGATQLSSDIFVFSDFSEDDPLRRDLRVFEEHFGGVLPMEVLVESKTPGQFRTLANLRRIERLERELDSLDAVTRTLSATRLVKVANQAYFGGNPATYRLPSGYEMPFLQNALRSLLNRDGRAEMMRNLPVFVDSTFGMTRVYLGVGDIGTERMNALADTVRAISAAAFPSEHFEVTVTGTAMTATRSGESLVRNLIGSLALALVLISGIMALLFRSLRLTFISLVPNVVPLLVVAGAMGFAHIHLKPSTALIFSLAFGIAVDDTIHFLAKYRLLLRKGLPPDEAVRTTLRETGKAILFTSLVLMAGFLVFTLSSFGGTANMGALTALTLGAALLANLFLLPALLFRFGDARHPASLEDVAEFQNVPLTPGVSSVE